MTNTASVEWRQIVDTRLILIQSAQNIAEFIGRALKMPVVHQFSSKIQGCPLQSVSGSPCTLAYAFFTLPLIILWSRLFCVLCSTNGTYLNWERLKKNSQEAKICHGDIISLAAAPQHGYLSFHFLLPWLYLHLADIALPAAILLIA